MSFFFLFPFFFSFLGVCSHFADLHGYSVRSACCTDFEDYNVVHPVIIPLLCSDPLPRRMQI